MLLRMQHTTEQLAGHHLTRTAHDVLALLETRGLRDHVGTVLRVAQEIVTIGSFTGIREAIPPECLDEIRQSLADRR